MKVERTFAGLEASNRAHGLARIPVAAFLTFWLCGWLAGEVVVLVILAKGAWSLLTGEPLKSGDEPMGGGGVLAVGGFLLVWLTFWTIGGLAAGREWLRLVFGKERAVAAPDGLMIEKHFGLFAERTHIPRDQLRRFYVAPGKGGLSVATTRGVKPILAASRDGDLGAIASAFNAEYRLPERPPAEGMVAADWVEERSPENKLILVRDPAARHKQALVSRIVGIVFGLVALVLAGTMATTLGTAPLMLMAGAVSVFAFLGARRLARRREEWVVGPGSLRLQVRYDHRATPAFAAESLQLDESRDSDGDVSHRLVALAGRDPLTSISLSNRDRYRTLATSMTGDPTDLRAFGHWLSRHARIPFHDRAGESAKAQDFEEARRKLAESGRLGRWLADRLPRGGKGS